MRSNKQVSLSAALALVICGFANVMSLQAGDIVEPMPWDERTTHAPLVRSDYSGVLSLERLRQLTQRGEALFAARFTKPDGVGRPMATQAIIPTKRKRPPRDNFQRMAGLDANACTSCHNVPSAGGAGDFTANVFVSEGFTNVDFDSSDPQFSNERNTNHLFGAGLIELLAREMTADLQVQRSQAVKEARSSGNEVIAKLESKGVSFGAITIEPDGMVDLSNLDGVDTDLVIRPFSQKGVMTSLRQFTINALNHHHGIQAVERFGTRWTGEKDFDEDGINDELGAGDVSALVAWQATLPPPGSLNPANPNWKKAASTGSQLFDRIGCQSCHRRELPLTSLKFADPGRFDAAGTLRGSEDGAPATYDLALMEWAKLLKRNDKGEVLVPLFGDLKRHRIADQKNPALGNELLAQRFVDRDTFMTAELWGIATTAPYGHRGDITTLDEMIRAHGGEATNSTNAYLSLAAEEQSALIAYLKTLVIEP